MTEWENVKCCKGVKICHNNIRSLLPKFEEFSLNYLDSGIDVLGETETWLHELVSDSLISNPSYRLLTL